MHSSSRFCLAVTLCLIANPLFSQYTLETISGDTVFAGQLTEILIVDPGMTRPEHLEAIFMREDPVSFPPCWWCPMDSLRAQSVVTDGSVITATFDIPEDAYPGRFSLTVYDGVSWATWDYMYILSKPYIYDVTGKATICKGEGTQFKVIYYGSGNILKQWYHGDEHLTYATGDSLWVGPAVVKDTGWYHCVLKNQWGEDTASFRLEIPYLEEIGTPVGPERFCNGGGISQYTLQEDPLIALYHWILIPFSAGTLEEEGSTVSISWNAAFSGEAMLFAETGTGTCDLSNSDTLSIWIGPDQVPDICIVGVDEETGKYRVVWNKLLDVPVSAYNVYRESNQAGVFLKLGILSGEEFSVFLDSSSSPESLPHSYRISYTDTCGNESGFSPVHTTIHLSANLGTGGVINLNWTPYQGFAFLTYEIYRGSHPDSLVLFQTVASNVNTYTDREPPSKQVFYQIVVSKDGECQPEKKGSVDYSVSRSNMLEINTIGIEPRGVDPAIMIYPNPANRSVTITLPRELDVPGILSIYNMTGSKMSEYQFTGRSTVLSTDRLGNGIYVLKLISPQYTIVERFVISR